MYRSSSVWPLSVTSFFKALDDAVKGVLVRGLKLFSFWLKELFDEIPSDLGWLGKRSS